MAKLMRGTVRAIFFLWLFVASLLALEGTARADGVNPGTVRSWVLLVLDSIGVTSGGVYTPPASFPSWSEDASGDIVPDTDNADDIGDATFRPRTVRAATSMVTPLVSGLSGATLLVEGADGGSGVQGRGVTVQAGDGNAFNDSGAAFVMSPGSDAGVGGTAALTGGTSAAGSAGGAVTLTGGDGNDGATSGGALSIAGGGAAANDRSATLTGSFLTAQDSTYAHGSSAARWQVIYTDHLVTTVLVTTTNPTTGTEHDAAVIVLSTGSSTVEYDLPQASTLPDGWRRVVKRVGTNAGTIDPNGTELIDGSSTSYSLGTDYQSVTIVKVTIGGTHQFVIE